VLLQDRNDLLFRMPLSLHRLVLSPRARLRFVLDQFKGATSVAMSIFDTSYLKARARELLALAFCATAQSPRAKVFKGMRCDGNGL
jgi:hypothetical protein